MREVRVTAGRRVLRRTFEASLGIVLWVFALVAALFVAGAVFVFVDGERGFDTIAMGLLGLAVLSFCIIIGWRLITGREHRDGGLFGSWIAYVEAFLHAMQGARSGMWYGPEFAKPHYDVAGEVLRDARKRRRRTLRTDQQQSCS